MMRRRPYTSLVVLLLLCGVVVNAVEGRFQQRDLGERRDTDQDEGEGEGGVTFVSMMYATPTRLSILILNAHAALSVFSNVSFVNLNKESFSKTTGRH